MNMRNKEIPVPVNEIYFYRISIIFLFIVIIVSSYILSKNGNNMQSERKNFERIGTIKLHYIKRNGMIYMVVSSTNNVNEGSISVRNLTLDSLKLESYK